ncbi:hypothetical protein LTR36_008100 [Oleoguttula mirabilis]|uniref:Ankyrin repeat protein n=1 Tax=Oleoguttula mirabilis TaxID=1507867 RepID=A0AAV9J9E5_9PEZI|nr:hypothetical protein LTR36_008100 [Oleoguttula mirabilis]
MIPPIASIADIKLPPLLAKHEDLLEYLAKRPHGPLLEILKPYHQYDAEMRKIFAQQPNHPACKQPSVVPIFAGHQGAVKVQSRDLNAESDKEKASYILPLKDEDRKPDHVPAIVQSLKEFKTNFNVFSESSLVDMDWSNVIAAGSSVVTSLLAVPEKHAESKRALRHWYHEQLAPASDVDLFLYGLTEEQAVAKIKQIERSVRDALLVETTAVRTRNTITIASQYPVRHVQIVLRIYRSISEILTGFDVDCSCVAYDGQQVWASPRALAAYMTQINTVDLTRRSPSYEYRLSKYAKRGFEVYWPALDRSRVDPTIFERSFGRVEGLARLLVLEKLPKSKDRDEYLDQRRAERGRPRVNRLRQHALHGNIKDDYEDEVADWVGAMEVSDYHTFTIPYGPNYHARKIEKLVYTKDMLLNAEWNKPKDREVNLHRHPAFFGTVDDVIHNCCGYCPKPSTVEEEEVAEEESKLYVSGNISFIKEDPGRQAIGSFNPLTADDWTEMAYVSNTGMLCQAIVDGDADFVLSWLEQDGNDPNARDWTGRAPLHLAAANSTLEIVQLLIDYGARIVARLVDGKTALHLAAMRGDVPVVSALLRKSEANEAETGKLTDARRAIRKAAKAGTPVVGDMQADKDLESPRSETASLEHDSDVDLLEDADENDDVDATTENSMVKIKTPSPEPDDKAFASDDDDGPDVYDVNVLAWDTAASPLHLAIIMGHVGVVKCLVQEFGADVLTPVKLFNDHDKSARAAVLTLVLALQLPVGQADEMSRTLVQLGASAAQADLNQVTALQYCVADSPNQLQDLICEDRVGVGRVINHLSVSGYRWSPEFSGPLLTAIDAHDSPNALKLLSIGAKPVIDFTDYMSAHKTKHDALKHSKQNRRSFETTLVQPILKAVQRELPLLAKALLVDHAIDPNQLALDGYRVIHDEYSRNRTEGQSLLDVVKAKLEQLRDWKPDETTVAPEPLKDDDSYLSRYEESSYALWSAQQQVASAKEKLAHDLQHYQSAKNDKRSLEDKQTAISQLTREFEDMEHALIVAGAKTFEEQYPEVEKPDSRNSRDFRLPKPKLFEVEIDFTLGDLDEETNGAYVSMFEACWVGDAATVKRFTLTAWKSSEGSDRLPLQVAVQDQHGMSPFAIAVAHDNFEMASMIVSIAQAQHVPTATSKERRYRLGRGGSEDEGSDEDVAIHSEVVDDQFTIECIGEASLQVKSPIAPLAMIEWSFSACFKLSKSSNFAKHKPGKPCNLLQLALFHDDIKLLNYLLGVSQECVRRDCDQRFYSINEKDFTYAVEANNPHLLEAMVQHTGAGLPLDHLVKVSGAETGEQPKHYQGLSVHGKKRQNWAAARHGPTRQERTENYRAPLLVAAHQGSLKLVEWFLSDAPMRCYKSFSETYADDKRLQRLAQVTGGFATSVKNFLASRSELSIHCCLMGSCTSGNDQLLRYLVNTLPASIDTKSSKGLTPLSIAMKLYDDEAVRILIEAGADQTARDEAGNNLVHCLLSRRVKDDKQLQKLPVMLDLIDKRILPGLFLERSKDYPGSVTPLARWMRRASPHSDERERDAETLRILLRYSGGVELDVVNGAGDTPLHVSVRETLPNLTKVILDHDPTLLNRENATGRTPFEVAEDAAVAALCSGPPPLPGAYSAAFEMRRARRNGLPQSWAKDVVDRPSDDFVVEPGRDGRDHREKVWDLLQDTKQKLGREGKAKRRLVTLHEANEVARRLAATESGSTTSRSNEDEAGTTPKVVDEVEAWLSDAIPRL